jgi:hypothetical protein
MGMMVPAIASDGKPKPPLYWLAMRYLQASCVTATPRSGKARASATTFAGV